MDITMRAIFNSGREITQRAKGVSKLISAKMHLSDEEAGRLTYTLILAGLARKLEIKLCFEDERMNELCQKVADEVSIGTDEILRNSHLIDLLYEELVSKDFRKKTGQFITPNHIAEFMASWVGLGNPNSILDPSVGTGIFLENALKSSHSTLSTLWGFDIDPIMLNACQVRLAIDKLSNRTTLNLTQQDFIRMGGLFAERADAVICNPPYLNFHDFDRNGLVTIMEKRCGIKLSKLTNIYVLFFLQSLALTKIGGRLAFITPSEFLYTGYGEELKEFLLRNSTLDSLILMDLNSSLFNKALTTAIVTLFRRGKPPEGHKVRFIRIFSWPNTNGMIKAVTEGVESPGKYRIVEIEQNDLDPRKKWLEHFIDIRNSHVLDKLIPLFQLADVDRGIATGFNAFFVLSKSELNKWKVEDRFVVPAVSNASQIQGYSFTVSDWNRLVENGEKAFLLYVFEKPSENLSNYVTYGEQELNAHKRYITKHRSPWFSMERKEPSMILATVFHRREMRFIFNEANVRNLASFHCVYPRFKNIRMVKALLAFLNSDLCREIQTIKRREYGGGLHKFEPKDLEHVPVIDISHLSITQLENLASLFDELCLANNEEKERHVRSRLDESLHQIIAET